MICGGPKEYFSGDSPPGKQAGQEQSKGDRKLVAAKAWCRAQGAHYPLLPFLYFDIFQNKKLFVCFFLNYRHTSSA